MNKTNNFLFVGDSMIRARMTALVRIAGDTRVEILKTYESFHYKLFDEKDNETIIAEFSYVKDQLLSTFLQKVRSSLIKSHLDDFQNSVR